LSSTPIAIAVLRLAGACYITRRQAVVEHTNCNRSLAARRCLLHHKTTSLATIPDDLLTNSKLDCKASLKHNFRLINKRRKLSVRTRTRHLVRTIRSINKRRKLSVRTRTRHLVRTRDSSLSPKRSRVAREMPAPYKIATQQ
jgi:hypothetical protein